jgi:hypothetical protein
MGVAKEIADFLSGDIVDGIPADVITRNPNFGWNTGNLPEFTYKSLGTLWIGPSTTEDKLLKRIKLQIWGK